MSKKAAALAHQPAAPTNGQLARPDQSMGYQLWQTSNLWQRHMRDALAPLNLTHVQYVLLAGLQTLADSHGGRAVTQIKLANFAGTDKMMTSKVLRTLEVKKLVERQNHATDTRAKSLIITAAGLQVLQKALVVVRQSDQAFFEVLGKKNEKMSTYMHHLLLREPLG
jgi:MarR family transcriptional regulator, organic hydroperoxide resistance regulator